VTTPITADGAEPREPRTLFGKPLVGGSEILAKRLRRELERNIEPSESVHSCLRGDLGHALAVLDDRLVILKSGFHAGTTFGAMSTTIYLGDVTGIHIRTHMLSGWIEISSPSFQGRERKHMRHPRPSDRDVYKLPNCVPINRRHIRTYGPVLSDLRRRIAAVKVEHPHVGVIGELERLAALRRDGMLDDDEFAAAKAKLLGADAA